MQRFPAGEKLIATEADLLNFAHKEAKAKERDRKREALRAAASVSLPVHLRDAIDTEAQVLGLSRAALVANWAKKLAKKHGLKKTTSTDK